MANFHLSLLFILLSAWEAATEYCPDDWTLFGGQCYRYIPFTVQFDAAQDSCNRLSGYVAEINSAAEGEFLHDLRGSQWIDYAFIGLTDRATENVFIWDSSRTTASYTNWRAGEPNNAGNEDCVQMANNGREWLDISCYAYRHYFCERPAYASKEVWSTESADEGCSK